MSWALFAFAAVVIFLLARFVRSLGDPHALTRGGHVHRLRALLENDPDRLDARDQSGRTLLHEAAKHGELEVLRFLLARGVDVNAKTPVGATALHEARAFKEDEAVKILLAAGAKDG